MRAAMIIGRRNGASNSDASVRFADRWNGCLFRKIGIRRICERGTIGLNDRSPEKFRKGKAMQVRDASLMTQPPAESGLSIVIVTYNSAAVLPGLLDSLPAGLEGVKQF